MSDDKLCLSRDAGQPASSEKEYTIEELTKQIAYLSLENKQLKDKNEDLHYKNENKKVYNKKQDLLIDDLKKDFGNPTYEIIDSSRFIIPLNNKLNKLYHTSQVLQCKYMNDILSNYKDINKMINFINSSFVNYNEKLDLLKTIILYLTHLNYPYIISHIENMDDLNNTKERLKNYKKYVIPYYNIYLKYYKIYNETDEDLYNLIILMMYYNQIDYNFKQIELKPIDDKQNFIKFYV